MKDILLYVSFELTAVCLLQLLAKTILFCLNGSLST